MICLCGWCCQVSEVILDNKTLEFYKWDGEVKDKLAAVKDKINELADSWTRQQKDHCLEETTKSFQVGLCTGVTRTCTVLVLNQMLQSHLS